MSLFESLDALEALNNTPKKEEKLVVKPINKGDLTDEQYSIVHSDDQVIKVKAYAGTGKTFTLKKYAERYGLNTNVVYPHSFRHRYAKNFLERFNDIALLADLMGHESIETTRIYLRRTSSEQQAIVDKVITW